MHIICVLWTMDIWPSSSEVAYETLMKPKRVEILLRLSLATSKNMPSRSTQAIIIFSHLPFVLVYIHVYNSSQIIDMMMIMVKNVPDFLKRK